MRRGSIKNRILDYWVGVPLLNAFATFRRRRKRPATIRRVGVMCSPALGDTLLVSGAFRDVRRHYGNAVEIVHFCMKTNLAAAELLHAPSRRVVIDLTDPLGSIKAMRAEQLDILFDFSSWQRLTAFYSLMSGAKFTAGFSTAGQHRGRGYDLQVEHRADRHEVDNFRALLVGMNIANGLPPKLFLPPGAPNLGCFADASDIVALHPWASGQRSWLREWPEDRWIELAQTLAGPSTVFAITGAPSDLARIEPFCARMAAAGLVAHPFVGADGFRSLSHLLLRVRVLVSVNTGVMHLAAILGVPTVSINGPNRNGRWGPVGPRAIGVEAPGEGCGYLHLGFNFDGQATDCMERITVPMVVDAVVAAIALPEAD
jgi:ADP-heptose:LPS heptosyltransferase